MNDRMKEGTDLTDLTMNLIAGRWLRVYLISIEPHEALIPSFICTAISVLAKVLIWQIRID